MGSTSGPLLLIRASGPDPSRSGDAEQGDTSVLCRHLLDGGGTGAAEPFPSHLAWDKSSLPRN